MNWESLQNDPRSKKFFKQVSDQFEESCLFYLKEGKFSALREFLRLKLDLCDPNDNTQKTILALWVVHLILDQINVTRFRAIDESEVQKWRAYLSEFVRESQIVQCIRKSKRAFYDLVGSFGDDVTAGILYELCDDFEPVIREKIDSGDYETGLNLMKGVNNLELINKVLPLMMKYLPEQTIDALKLIGSFHGVQTIRLVPTMMSILNKQNEHLVAKFFQFCYKALKLSESAIHNFLVHYYAEYRPDDFLDYLEREGTDLNTIRYDVYFAIEVANEFKRLNAGVHLYVMLEEWEKALELALKYDLTLAKSIANSPSYDSEELRKKLWLNIAKHVCQTNSNSAEVEKIIKQSNILTIEDVLIFFPDFVTIKNLKETLCSAIKDYNCKIEKLTRETEETELAAKNAESRIQQVHDRCMTVRNDEKCEICNINLVSQPFYLFPCRHKFHASCILFEMTPFLSVEKKDCLMNLQRQLDFLNKEKIENSMSIASSLSVKERIRNDIDSLLAAECYYCGEAMLKKIQTPFFDLANYHNIYNDWI